MINEKLKYENEDEIVEVNIDDLQDESDEEIEKEIANEEDIELIDIITLTNQYTRFDPVRSYLVEIGQIPLLSKEEELNLFKEYELCKSAKDKLKQFEDYEIDLTISEEKNLKDLVDKGDKIKEKIVNANLRLVVSIAKRYTCKNLTFLDLIQEGSLGLMKGVDRFDCNKGLRFSTYATWWIRQGITRAIGDQSRIIRLPIHMIERIAKYVNVQKALTMKLYREPTKAEIAEEMGISLEKLDTLELYFLEPTSLENKVSDDDDTTLSDFIEDKSILNPEEACNLDHLQKEVRMIVEKLNKKEQYIIIMRFGLQDGKCHTLEEVGNALHLTRERIRQIEVKALKKLKRIAILNKLDDFVLKY